MSIFLFILCAVIGYAIGSVNSSILVGKFYGTDVRTQGSKNAGLTNTLRVLGKRAALMVLAGDILKGVIAVLIGVMLKTWSQESSLGELYGVMAGTFAVIGHNWPVYFKFKGGKGILTTATVIFMLDWKIGLIVLALFVIIVAIFRLVSLGSIIGSVAIPVVALALGHSIAFIIFMLFLAVLAIYRHKANIGRLVNGTENKLSFKKKDLEGSKNE
ncbi:MAG: glycerol-3-phosphate 1-O-acyltransferase PlsY [Clostridiales bacterium]|nr:glycerol-3-phosphate 1-O-acyltransferase PlsY [Clostridiales bacterium]